MGRVDEFWSQFEFDRGNGGNLGSGRGTFSGLPVPMGRASGTRPLIDGSGFATSLPELCKCVRLEPA